MQKRKIIIMVVSLVVAGILVVVGTLLMATEPVEAKGQCHKINTTLTSVADLAAFTTEGVIKSGFLKGTTQFTGDPVSLSLITSVPSPPVEPLTFSYTGALTITTDKGTLTTRSVGVFEGVPFGLGSQFDRVVGGTGIFEGAKGNLFYNFEADDMGQAFVSAVSGEICLK